MPSRNRDKAAGRQTQSEGDGVAAARIATARSTHPGHASFEPMPIKATCTKKMQLVPAILPAGRQKLNQSLAMIPDKGCQHALVRVPPIRRRSATAQRLRNFRQCPSRLTLSNRNDRKAASQSSGRRGRIRRLRADRAIDRRGQPGRLREDQVDPEDHQPDEDAGAERADRKFARRRARRGLCRGGAGSPQRRPAGRDHRPRARKPAHQAHRQPDELDRADDRALARRAHGRSVAERHRADRPQSL